MTNKNTGATIPQMLEALGIEPWSYAAFIRGGKTFTAKMARRQQIIDRYKAMA